MNKKNKIPWFHTIVCFKVLMFSLLYLGNGFANTYVPNTLTDPVITTLNNATGQINGGATISLRSALMAADNLGGTHTITLSTGTYNLTQAVPGRQITIGNTSQNITINGNGPANTIISNTLDANKDRILFINPSGTTNSPVITVNGIKFQNAYLSSDPYGGAAICAGGGSAESLTINNCVFDNNVLPANAYGGAAVCMQVRGNLTIDNSTFTNNVSNDADGGAVLFIIFSSALGTGYGTLSVTNSTFSGNSVIFPNAGTSNGGALAFTGQGGSTPFNATVSNNTFINNTADGLGGAISANNSPNVSVPQLHFNRFSNNTSTASALSSGLHFVESSGSVNAENNWWGCNSNPVNVSSTAPCNQAGGDVAGGGSLDVNPWLQLKTTAAPNPICNTTPTTLGNTSFVTTSFLNNSDGTAIPVANLSRLIGLPVTWTSTLGSLSGQQTTIQAAGTATATFTSGGTAGTATVNTQVDNVPASEATPARANIIVNATSIAPTGATGTTTICKGSSTTLTVTGGLKGSGASAEWFTGSCGGALIFTGDALIVSPTSTITYYVRYNGTCNITTCGSVTVTVNDPSIAPSGITGTTVYCNPGSTILTAVGGTLGTGANYQWGTGVIAGTNPIGGATSSTLNISPTSTTTYWVRIENTTAPCPANTSGITQVVTVNQPSTAPTAITGTTTICNPVSTILTAVGGTLGTGANYQWGTGAVAGTNPIGGATSSTLNVSPTSTTTYWVRIENTTAPCVANTAGITQVVTVNQPSTAPTAITGTTTICNPGSTILTAVGGTLGTGANYQWGTGAVAGTNPIGGATSSTLNISPTTTTTYWVRIENTTAPCVANTGGITQVVTVNQPSTAPTTITGTLTICNPGSTILSAVGGTLGTGANYQWGTGGVAGTNPIGGATSSTLNVSPTSTTTFWVRIENTTAPCVANTAGITQVVTVNQPSTAPTAITGTTTICNPGSTILTAAGGTLGTGANYQWGTGAVAGTSPIGGATSSTLNVSPTATTTYWVRIENTTTPCAANSGGITQVVTVSLDNTITLSSGANNQTVPVSSPITTVTWSTSGATGATFNNLPPGVNGNWAMNEATISGTPTTQGSYNYTVNLSGGCNGGFAGGTINVTQILPIKLISFNGKLNTNRSVSLLWTVEEQKDIIQYDVEESTDGFKFSHSGTVPAGNSLSQTYSYIDRQVTSGNNYYRLRIVELSGKIEYSNMVLVNLKADNTVMLYPNPITQKLTIRQFGTIRNKTAVLLDAQGKIMQHIKLNSLLQEVNMENCTSGVYFLKLEDGTVFKVVKH